MKTLKNKFGDLEFKTVYVDRPDYLVFLDPKKLTGIDIETSKIEEYKDHPSAGLCPLLSNIRLIQFYQGEDTVYVFDMRKFPLETLKAFLQEGRFVAHNGKFEILHLTHAGIPNMDIGCSMLLSQLVDGAEHSPYEPPEDDEEEPDGLGKYKFRSHSLDACVQRLFKVKVEKSLQTSNWSAEELSNDQIAYAALDAVLTYKVAKVLATKVKEYKMERSYKLLKDMQHVVAEMELNGIPVDWEYHSGRMKDWKEKLTKADAACKPFFGETNMRSSKQMGEWAEKNLRPEILSIWPKTDKGAYTFTKTAIGAFVGIPAIAALLEYKKYSKLLDTYGQSLIDKKHPLTGRLHGSYTLGMTRTGRLSSRNPNLQNMPRDKEFRNMFKAPDGYALVVSDFSQIELRLQAEFSKDPAMCKNYKEGLDIYCIMASILFGRPITKKDKLERFTGKTVMLALGYGMGSKKLAMYCLNVGIKQPQAFWDKAHKKYHTTFSTYSSWCNKMRDRATKLGYIETLLGKRRKLDESEIFTSSPNTIIQGTSAELTEKALLICQEKVVGLAGIITTVHDELALLCRKENTEKVSKLLQEAMCSAMIELFPNAVSHDVAEAAYGERWGDIKAEL